MRKKILVLMAGLAALAMAGSASATSTEGYLCGATYSFLNNGDYGSYGQILFKLHDAAGCGGAAIVSGDPVFRIVTTGANTSFFYGEHTIGPEMLNRMWDQVREIQRANWHILIEYQIKTSGYYQVISLSL